MQKLVFIIKEDTLDAHGKTQQNVSDLLDKMREYGTVEDYDANVAALKGEYQAVIDEITSRYEAIKGQNLDEAEIRLVNLFRELLTIKVKSYVDKNVELEGHIDTMKAEAERCANLIMEALGK